MKKMYFFAGFVVGGIVMFFASGMFVTYASDLRWKRELVKRGYAEWQSSESGSVEWIWKKGK